jgi:hypothetical protein
MQPLVYSQSLSSKPCRGGPEGAKLQKGVGVFVDVVDSFAKIS